MNLDDFDIFEPELLNYINSFIGNPEFIRFNFTVDVFQRITNAINRLYPDANMRMLDAYWEDDADPNNDTMLIITNDIPVDVLLRVQRLIPRIMLNAHFLVASVDLDDPDIIYWAFYTNPDNFIYS